MIKSVGYTEDGTVWMNVVFKHEGHEGCMIITMPIDQAREVSMSLNKAAESAAKYGDKIVGSNGNDGVTK
ncbi:MAG: hypothetical protein KAJ09_01530, partial [Deltaproteobacteria bacterium]|nr:hypothetical protein [Deltaproteobacteria bacterium]